MGAGLLASGSADVTLPSQPVLLEAIPGGIFASLWTSQWHPRVGRTRLQRRARAGFSPASRSEADSACLAASSTNEYSPLGPKDAPCVDVEPPDTPALERWQRRTDVVRLSTGPGSLVGTLASRTSGARAGCRLRAMIEALHQATQELTAPGAPFEIATVPIRGVPTRVFAKAPTSLRAVWLGSRAHGDAVHLVYEDERWTFEDAHRDVARIAQWLVSQGVDPGDRVAIAMRNHPEWLLVFWATTSIGAVVVGMNAWWTPDEMAYALGDSTPKVVVCDVERLERLVAVPEATRPQLAVAVRCPDPLPEGVVPFAALVADETVGPDDLPEADIDPDADACLFYTSGTTGNPKGARLTHRSCTNNLHGMAWWAAAQARARQLAGESGKPSAPRAGGRPQLSSLVTTPLFHVTANNCVAQPATLSGGKVVLMYKWDATRALELIERERVTTMGGVPTMTRELLAHPKLDDYDLSSLALIGGGGAKFQSDLVDKVERRKGTTRPNTGYGLTETSGIITANSADFLVAKPESVGPALPSFETRLVDDDGNDVTPGTGRGELWVRGAQVVAGYWNRPDATAEAITEGWFHTGDIATIDADGFIEIVDRKKDMVLRGGENVYSSEVESVLFAHPAVAECAVFGVPDERLGEEVGVAVRLHEGSDASPAELRGHCRERIAAHKVPRYVWITREPLPRNANGKFVKRELREGLDPAAADDGNARA